jgi:hypothetical protein
MRTGDQIIRVNVSMVSLKWGDAISVLLPGALALFALAGFFPALDARISNIEQIGTAFGFALLMAAALTGELLGVITRLLWERYWLVPHCNPPDALKNLKSENLELYERGVQNNYKYVTFYANFAWATGILIISRLHKGDKPCSAILWLLVIATIVLLRGSHVQWTYFVNYLNKIFGERKPDVR